MPPGPRHLLVVRHGQSTWNADGRWQGQADPPLSALGELQAADAGRRLATLGIASVVASDLVRARTTAEVIAGALGTGDVRLDPGLREIDVGDWTGLTRSQIKARWPGALAAWSEGRRESPPGGESRTALAERASATLTRVGAGAPPGDRVLVVSHGALIRHLDRVLGLAPRPIANLAGRWYDADGCGGLTPGILVSLVDLDDETISPSV